MTQAASVQHDSGGISFQLQARLLSVLGVDSPLVFDVGANVGQSITAYRSVFPDCSIHSFEPSLETYRILDKNFGASSGITCEQLALSNESGEVRFFVANDSQASSLLTPDETVAKKSPNGNYEGQHHCVVADTLDHYCTAREIERINVLKLDVQGAEDRVLEGGRSLLSRGAIDLIFCEVLFAENYQEQIYFYELSSLLKRHDYALWDLPRLHRTGAGRLWFGDAVYVRQQDIERIASSLEIT